MQLAQPHNLKSHAKLQLCVLQFLDSETANRKLKHSGQSTREHSIKTDLILTT